MRYLLFIIFFYPVFCFALEKKPYAPYLTPGKLTVLVTFDGSKDLKKWSKILEFSKQENIKCTFFVSGVYFLSQDQRHVYQYPRDTRKTGVSDIGFGGSPVQVQERRLFIQRVLQEGHAIESHLNGHFPAYRWTSPMWENEFHQFSKFLSFTKPCVAIRFPLLQHNNEVYPTLKKYGYTAIVSAIMPSYTHFYLHEGILIFPISNIDGILNMDYNFYLVDLKRKRRGTDAKKHMVNAYLKEAERCFKEKRPFFINHHFSAWNKEAYFEALKEAVVIIKKKYPTAFITVPDLIQKVH